MSKKTDMKQGPVGATGPVGPVGKTGAPGPIGPAGLSCKCLALPGASNVSWNTLSSPERSRTYHLPNDYTVTVWDVCKLRVSKSGTHYLEALDGGKFIVRSGWDVIEIDADEWSF